MPVNSSTKAASAAGRASVLARWRRPDDPELIDARLELRELVLSDTIAEALAANPPFRPDQLARLVAQLEAGTPR